MDVYSENIFDRIEVSLGGIEGLSEVMWDAYADSNVPGTLKITLAHVRKTVEALHGFLNDNFGEIKVEMEVEGDKMLRVIFDPVKSQNKENGSVIQDVLER